MSEAVTSLKLDLVFALVLSSLAFFPVLQVARGLGGGYSDEAYYIASGSQYVRCLPPIYSNPEHPPLAKYIIGLSSLADPRIAPAIAGFVSVLVASLTVLKIRGDMLVAVLTSLVLASEVAFVKTFGYALLDSVAVVFASAATYLSLRGGGRVLSGALWGAALASKLSTAYPFAGVIVLRLSERGFRDVLVEVSSAAAVYAASFVGDLACPGGGLGVFLQHLLLVPSYMLSTHSLTIYKAVHGLLIALLKVDMWRSANPVTITLTPGTNASIQLPASPSGIEVEVYPWLSGFLLPTSVALITYAALRFRSLSREGRAVALLTAISYINVLHGPIFWYLTLPTYYLAILAGTLLSRKTLTALAVANVVSLGIVYLSADFLPAL